MGVIAGAHPLEGVDEPIAEFLDDHPAVANQALDLLVHLKSPLATPVLLRRLEWPEPAQRHDALGKLVAIGAKEAAPHLERMMTDEAGANNRIQAARALVRLDARGSAEALYRWAEKDGVRADPFVVAGLVKWEHPNAAPMAMWRVRRDRLIGGSLLAPALIELDAQPIVPYVIEMLADPTPLESDIGHDKNTRANAIYLLGGLRARRAIPLLREIAGGGDEFLKHAAARVLGLLRAEEAVPELTAMLWGDYNDWSAATEALARIGGRENVARVVQALKRHPPNFHHVQVLDALNASADGGLYERINTLEIPAVEGSAARMHLARLNERAQIPMSLSPQALEGDGPGVSDFAGQVKVRSVLERIVATLNYSAYRCAWIIQKGEVRIVTIEEAYAFWEAWLAGEAEH